MHTTGRQSTAGNHHALWRRVLTQTALAASFALILVLAACVPSSMPRAGTLPVPTTTSTQDGTTPAGSPRPSHATNATNPPAPATYEPATPTSPAKNVPNPVMPALAKDKSEAGQRAFIGYWLDTYNYMRETGDTKPFLAACHKDSKFCRESAKSAEEFEHSKAWRVGGKLTFYSLKQDTDWTQNTFATFSGYALEAPLAAFDDNGEVPGTTRTTKPTKYEVAIALERIGNHWGVNDVGGTRS